MVRENKSLKSWTDEHKRSADRNISVAIKKMSLTGKAG